MSEALQVDRTEEDIFIISRSISSGSLHRGLQVELCAAADRSWSIFRVRGENRQNPKRIVLWASQASRGRNGTIPSSVGRRVFGRAYSCSLLWPASSQGRPKPDFPCPHKDCSDHLGRKPNQGPYSLDAKDTASAHRMESQLRQIDYGVE